MKSDAGLVTLSTSNRGTVMSVQGSWHWGDMDSGTRDNSGNAEGAMESAKDRALWTKTNAAIAIRVAFRDIPTPAAVDRLLKPCGPPHSPLGRGVIRLPSRETICRIR
jgi:hypothetical protein